MTELTNPFIRGSHAERPGPVSRANPVGANDFGADPELEAMRISFDFTKHRAILFKESVNDVQPLPLDRHLLPGRLNYRIAWRACVSIGSRCASTPRVRLRPDRRSSF